MFHQPNKAMYQTIIFDIQDAICRITLNQPAVFNALSKEMLMELRQAFEVVAADDAIRVVVLTGSGDKAFSSGQNLKSGLNPQMDSLGDFLRTYYNPLILAMRKLPKPIICELNGVAVGAGCSLALACDTIIASENASMAQLFVGIGLIMDAGASFFLPRIIGTQKAFELCSTGKSVNAQECLRLGLVNALVAPDSLRNQVQQMAEMYANAPTKAIGMMKKLLNESSSSTLEECLEREAVHQEMAGQTEDFIEGLAAFMCKKKPSFKGR